MIREEDLQLETWIGIGYLSGVCEFSIPMERFIAAEQKLATGFLRVT